MRRVEDRHLARGAKPLDVEPLRPENRLAREASPYLLQHARNPVDWFPWGEEALAEAKRRDVPILLSVGYSACHWCHVMERESFEDEAIARLMNERYVNVKVDREERPDLAQIYQLVVQLMGGSGGWPLTVFLTPETAPFFGGTYFPPEDRHGMPGFRRVLVALSDAYRDQREEVLGQAAELTEAIAAAARGAGAGGGAEVPGPDLLTRVTEPLLRRFDPEQGGFGRRPKFPNTMPLELLLRRGVLEGDVPSRAAARLALERMRAGGIWDHLGGGFHRYSTDERWLVPHFEKMLYDNALLLRAYAEGHRVFGGPLFERTALAITGWLTREMTDPHTGAFFASQDADSEGGEGRFFVWDEAEVAAAIGEDPLARRAAVLGFGVTAEGTFEDHGVPTGKSVLHEAMPIGALAARLEEDPHAAFEALERARAALFAARERRPRPARDEKLLTSWNALMISALADASGALGRSELLGLAERALVILSQRLVLRDGKGLRVARLLKGEIVKEPGFLDDHAYLVNAALDVYEAAGDPALAMLAREIAAVMVSRFHTEESGFFFTAEGGEQLVTRPQDAFDNAVPSGTAMACRALLRLGTLAEPPFGALAERELARLAPTALANPLGHAQLVCELDRLVRGSVDVVLVGPRDHATTRALAATVLARYLPNRTLAWVDPRDPRSVTAAASLAAGKSPAPDGAPVAYVCRGRTCSLPVREPDALAALLD